MDISAYKSNHDWLRHIYYQQVSPSRTLQRSPVNKHTIRHRRFSSVTISYFYNHVYIACMYSPRFIENLNMGSVANAIVESHNSPIGFIRLGVLKIYLSSQCLKTTPIPLITWSAWIIFFQFYVSFFGLFCCCNSVFMRRELSHAPLHSGFTRRSSVLMFTTYHIYYADSNRRTNSRGYVCHSDGVRVCTWRRGEGTTITKLDYSINGRQVPKYVSCSRMMSLHGHETNFLSFFWKRT